MPPVASGPRLPPPITENTHILASQIVLPSPPSISYAEYIATSDHHHHQHNTLELARQHIVNGVHLSSKGVLDSLLPIVCIGKDDAVLWIFVISGESNCQELCQGKRESRMSLSAVQELEAFHFDGLQRRHFSRFTPSTLYPCSTECATLRTPCSVCSRTTPRLNTSTPSVSSPATILPRASLRAVYTLFLDAVRDRLIDNICATSVTPRGFKATTTGSQTSKDTSKATRLGNGFLSIRHDVLPTWSAGWEYRSRKRPLVHTTLHVSLSESAIHIRPLPTLTTLFPLSLSEFCTPSQPTTSTLASCTSTLPLTPGTPLVLAPYQTPAFYVSTHQDNTIPASLLSKFRGALTGLGVHPFPVSPRVSSPRSTSSPSSKSPSSRCSTCSIQERFILVLIPLVNPQGEPKGLSALWPAHLVFVDTSPSRAHLKTLPEMPGTEVLLTPPRVCNSQLVVPSSLPFTTPSPFHKQQSRLSHRVSRAQRAFRVLELSSHKRMPGMPIPVTAKQAAGYVEGVAREREKERERANQERLRRERDIKEGKYSGPGPPAPTVINTEISHVPQSTIGTSTAGPSSKTPAGLVRTTSQSSMLSTFFAKAAQGAEANSFYPSPPDWDPVASTAGPSGTEISVLMPNLSTASNSATEPNSSSNAQSQSVSSVASQVIRDAIDLRNSMNLGMDMGLSLSDTLGFDMAVDLEGTGIMDGTFGSFTDDDFNYFDSTPAGLPISTSHMRSSLHGLGAEEGAVDGWLANGLQQVDTDATVHLQHNTPLFQGGTPTSIEADTTGQDTSISSRVNGIHVSEDGGDFLPSAPDLIPSSPAKSPLSPGSPPTPSLEFSTLSSQTGGKGGMFKPIAFGKSHWLADGKYRGLSGKFTFSQPSPYCLQSTLTPWSLPSLNSDRDDGWKLRYDAITDPRVGMVERLRGVKRKLPQTGIQHRNVVQSRSRHEEWSSLYSLDEDTDFPETSSSESDNEVEEPEYGPDHEDVSCVSHPSRPSTPPPTGLPLMATLLHTHFHHAHLLPMGVPMRASHGNITSPTDSPPVPISVPTPVSPAAGLGNASERNKASEILTQAVAKEVVENTIWADAWGVSPNASSKEHFNPVPKVSQADLRCISELLEKVDGLQGSMSLSELLQAPSLVPSTAVQSPVSQRNELRLMHPPWLSIGRAGLVHHMLPPAILFWEKEGLGPRSGPKDVVAFALFEGDERSALVEKWLERVSRAYSARGLGAHTVGNAGTFEHGLVPVQFEAVRKTLSNLMLVLPPEPPHIVLYIIASPFPSFCLKSSALRSIIMSQKRVPKLAGQHDFDQDRILIHFVPDYLVDDPHTYPSTRYVGLERFVTLVYDRLLRPTLRQMSRQFWECNPPFENRFQVPAYVLARKAPPRTHLEWDERPSLNVLDRHTFLQVGYRVSECGKLLVAACIDERGEAHDVAVWSVPDAPAINVNWVVSNIWIFVKQFAQRANTEWRIVVAKLGEMFENEAEEWMLHLETVASAYPGQPVHVSLVCAQNDVSLFFLPPSDDKNNVPTNTTTNPASVFTDVSSTTYSAFLQQRVPIISPGKFCPTSNPSTVGPAVPDEDPEQPPPKCSIGVLPLSTTVLFRVPNETDLTTVSTLYIHLLHTYKSAKSTLKQSIHEVHADITRNWYELAVLTRERWHFADNEELPFHLAALQVMSNVLSSLASASDVSLKDAEFLRG